MDFSGISILVIGDVMLDHYISGNAARISPEAPVPVVCKQKEWTAPGGAANVALGLAHLGCMAYLIGLAGDDAAGHTLQKRIGEQAINASIISCSGRPTTCKTRILASGQQLLRIDDETAVPPYACEMEAMLQAVDQALPNCQAVIFSDYDKGALRHGENGKSLCEIVIPQARRLNLPVLVDPKGTDWSKYAGASCITPNFAEFFQVATIFAGFDANTVSANQELRQKLVKDLRTRYKIDRLLLTCGEHGMTLYTAGDKPLRIHAVRREVADVSGAGDTVIATLAACIAAGFSWQESARIANTAAGVAVTKVGASPISIAELNVALHSISSGNPKLFDLPELQNRLNEWRHGGDRIVFTNGCFDLLHPGHISLLRQSAAFGDKLVVGLNTDASIKRLKGQDRPIQDEQSRAMLLSALQAVDAVIFFAEDTPEQLIHAIRPDVLVKGSDYRIEDIVGADFVQSYGGKVRRIELEPGQSTSRLVSLACRSQKA